MPVGTGGSNEKGMTGTESKGLPGIAQGPAQVNRGLEIKRK